MFQNQQRSKLYCRLWLYIYMEHFHTSKSYMVGLLCLIINFENYKLLCPNQNTWNSKRLVTHKWIIPLICNLHIERRMRKGKQLDEVWVIFNATFLTRGALNVVYRMIEAIECVVVWRHKWRIKTRLSKRTMEALLRSMVR